MISIYELLRRDQDGTSDYVKEQLTRLNIKFETDNYGNIFSFENGGVPVLSAHMDTVRKDADKCLGAFLTENDNPKIFTGGILGGDDKCGVYIILKVLEAGKKVNFIFSRDEEIGCRGIAAFVGDESRVEKLKKCLYGLVLDRRDNKDIVCEDNNYGTEEFQKALVDVANEKVIVDNNDGTVTESNRFKYRPIRGLCSDANTISKYISCANLSVGYFSPHREEEYIVKEDLETAYQYVLSIIDKVTTHFDAPEPKTYNYYNYGNNSYNYYGNSGYNSKDYYSKASKHYNDRRKSHWDYDFDDYDDWYDDWYGYGDYLEHYNSTKNKVAEQLKEHTCDFCDCTDESEEMIDITMPDCSVFRICSYCFEDLEKEVKRIRKEIDGQDPNKALAT